MKCVSCEKEISGADVFGLHEWPQCRDCWFENGDWGLGWLIESEKLPIPRQEVKTHWVGKIEQVNY